MRLPFLINGGLIASLSLLLAGCSLTATDVEPDLPTGQLNADNTLTYRANGRPVVAHNYTNLGTILLSIFGDGRPVSGKRYLDSTLVIRGADSQNDTPDGGKNHLLTLTLPKFRGLGTYLLQSPATIYQELGVPYNAAQAATSPPFLVVPTAPAQVVVTSWDATTRHLRGTFTLAASPVGQSTLVAITDGHFDLLVDQ